MKLLAASREVSFVIPIPLRGGGISRECELKQVERLPRRFAPRNDIAASGEELLLRRVNSVQLASLKEINHEGTQVPVTIAGDTLAVDRADIIGDEFRVWTANQDESDTLRDLPPWPLEPFTEFYDGQRVIEVHHIEHKGPQTREAIYWFE